MNKEQLIWLQKQQQILDDYIAQNRNLNTASEEIFSKKKIAFIVEFAELLNEKKDFKYWSTKPSSPQDVILEEYVDCLHFLISMSNHIGWIPDKDLEVYLEPLPSLTIISLDIIETFNLFSQSHLAIDFESLLSKFLQLGKLLDFNSEFMIEKYKLKNKINFHRQDINY